MAFQGDSIFWVETAKIVPNPYQPRREFDEHKLRELSESIRMYGILQPLTVTRKEIQREDGTFYSEYELIAGERRLRASSLAGIAQVPVIIRDGEQNEQEKLELAIIENLQREDLNAVDRALAFKQLADAFGLSHVQVAKKVGRSREYVSNSIRLLQLPEYMLTSLKEGNISEGHARTLLMLNDKPEEQDTVYREVLLKKLSVREVERIARRIAVDKVRKKDWHGLEPELLDLERQFTETLGTRVEIVKTEYGGKVTIDYFSSDDLSVMLRLLQSESGEALVSKEAAAAVSALSEHTPLAQVPEAESAPIVDDAPEAEVVQKFNQGDEKQVSVNEDPNPDLPENPSQAGDESPTVSTIAYEQSAVFQTAETPAPESQSAPIQTQPDLENTEKSDVKADSESEVNEEEKEKDTKEESTSDDSSLYSIRNFSV